MCLIESDDLTATSRAGKNIPRLNTQLLRFIFPGLGQDYVSTTISTTGCVRVSETLHLGVSFAVVCPGHTSVTPFIFQDQKCTYKNKIVAFSVIHMFLITLLLLR